MNRLLKISSITGSAAVPIAWRDGRATTRLSTRSPRALVVARQPGSTTVVAVASATTAGPSMLEPAGSASRRYRGASIQPPSAYIGTVATRAAPASPVAGGAATVLAPPSPGDTTSTLTDSTTTGRVDSRKAKRCL